MKRISPYVIIAIFIFLFSFILFAPSLFNYLTEEGLNPIDYARITELDYTAVLVDEPGSEGKIVVTERLTFDIHAAFKSNLFWELWHDLCEDWIDGVHVEYKVNYVKQILEDGTEIIYDESPVLYWEDEDYLSTNPVLGPEKWYHSEGPYDPYNDQYECVFFYVDGIYREEMVFEIQYEMSNAALKYNDCSDLYIALYSESSINYLESVKAQILIPNDDMPSPGNYHVTTYGTDANSFPVYESATANPGYYTFSFSLDEDDLQFSPYNEYIEFDLVSFGSDKHIFTDYAPNNDYTYDNVLEEILDEQDAYAAEPEKYEKIKTVIIIIASIISVIVFIYTITAKVRMRNKYLFFNPNIDFELYRDIPSDLDPHFASTLVFIKDKKTKNMSGVYSSLLLSLARKKYIFIDELADSNIIIRLNHDAIQTVSGTSTPSNAFTSNSLNVSYAPIQTSSIQTFTHFQPLTAENNHTLYESLTYCEKLYLNLILRHCTSSVMTMSSFQQCVSTDYDNTTSFVKKMDNSIVNIGVDNGYFQKANYNEPRNLMMNSYKFLFIIGIVLTFIVNSITNNTRLDYGYGAFFLLGITCIVCGLYMKKEACKHVLLTPYGESEYDKWRGLYDFLNSNTLINERTVIELPLWEKYLVYATAFGISEKVVNAISIRCPQLEPNTIINSNFCRSGNIRHFGHSFHSSVRSGSFSGGGGGGYGGGGRGGGGGGGGH